MSRYIFSRKLLNYLYLKYVFFLLLLLLYISACVCRIMLYVSGRARVYYLLWVVMISFALAKHYSTCIITPKYSRKEMLLGIFFLPQNYTHIVMELHTFFLLPSSSSSFSTTTIPI